jgi:hypothetical protein
MGRDHPAYPSADRRRDLRCMSQWPFSRTLIDAVAAGVDVAVVGLRWWFSDAERDWYTEPRGEETDQ